MAHEVARVLLEQADTFVKREQAVRTALEQEMPLGEIEEYLDWLELIRSAVADKK